ncbi:MAG TPA: hypothetical protein VJB82_04840 [Candidatus Peribacterales bacterium]|nr:hypothetical protein [Candidatus Peribacterales bacterium]
MHSSATTIRPASKALLLSAAEHTLFCKYLERPADYPFDLSASVLSGSVGVGENILRDAVHIADIFRRVSRSLHISVQSDAALRTALLRPFADLPTIQSSLINSPFYLGYFRMDFFIDPVSGALKIMEINSGGASLTDFLCSKNFLQHYHQYDLAGLQALDIPVMLRSILKTAGSLRPIRTLGFVAEENGESDYLWEYLEYAKWLQENAAIKPVFLSLTNGELKLLDHPKAPCPITALSDLDCIFNDWFEDLAGLECAEQMIKQHDILTIPMRSDLLFENKHYLSLLQTIGKPSAVSEEDWQLLQKALLRSFPLEEYKNHVEEVRQWPGVVLKMDIDCASENVFIYDFKKTSFAEALAALDRTLRRGHPSSQPFALSQGKSQHSHPPLPTWTIQKFTEPTPLTFEGSTPPWIKIDYAPYKHDLMTYMCYEGETPSVLFGSRCFANEKWDEMTEEGKKDGLWAPVSVL